MAGLTRGAPAGSGSDPPIPCDSQRATRLRSPLLVWLWALLAVEVGGGLVLFLARLVWGTAPGETLHVVAGLGLTGVYGVYQWRHWRRVAPVRPRLDYVLGLIAAATMALTLLSGLWLGAFWWLRKLATPGTMVDYPALPAALHNIGNMLVIAFVGAHLGAVLARDRTRDP